MPICAARSMSASGCDPPSRKLNALAQCSSMYSPALEYAVALRIADATLACDAGGWCASSG
jgi:hypothetical protein